MKFNTVEEALQALNKGEIIVVSDNEDRENEGDLIVLAEHATGENINFMARYGRGLICMPLSQELAKKANLYPMVQQNEDNHETAFTVSVDAVSCTTGISAFERAKTVASIINPGVKPTDLRRPGHMFPLVAKEGGVLTRPGHTEATVDLAKLCNSVPAGLCCEIMADNGEMMERDELFAFAKQHNLKFITIEKLIKYRENLL